MGSVGDRRVEDLTLPLLAVAEPGRAGGLRLIVGTDIAWLLRARGERSAWFDWYESDSTHKSIRWFESGNQTGWYSRPDVALVGGLGWRFPVGEWRGTVDARCHLGLFDRVVGRMRVFDFALSLRR
jgi:hypothetical protein